jgi:tRNA(Ile)-lysidine synthase
LKRGIELQSAHHFIKRHQLIKKNTTIVVGVSGGPDSMALLHFLWKNKGQWNVTLVAAHVDHMLRGEQSYDDYKAVASYCESHNIPFEGSRVDVRTYKEQRGVSTQVAARDARYKFFASVMKKYNANYLALGHHGDDQVETVIMNQVRGSVGFGQAGIPYSRPFETGIIIRPFLSITKEQIEQYCKEEKIIPRYDPSNNSEDYTRNRFRKKLLPFLKDENPNVHLRIQQQSELTIEDEQWLIAQAKEKLAHCIEEKNSEEVILSIEKYKHVPFPLQRRMIHLILKYLYGHNCQDLSFVHIQQVYQLLNSAHPSGELFLPNGLYIFRSYSFCTFSIHMMNKEDSFYEKTLQIPGHVNTPLGSIYASIVEELPPSTNGKNVFICDYAAITYPIVVRTRLPGDRMSIKGSKGTKKLKAIFIDQKISKHNRDLWPVVVDNESNVLWLPNLKLSNYANVSRNAEKYVILQYNIHKE